MAQNLSQYRKHNMKTRIFLILIGLLALQMTSCLPEDEDPYYENPEDKFLGVWKVNESCNRMTYDVEIVDDPDHSSQVLIYNFGNPGPDYDPVVGIVVSNTIYVESQTIGEGWTVSGEGNYYGLFPGKISWEYSLIIPPNEYNCTATYSP